MKIISRNIGKDGEGSVKMVAETGDDMWHAYNLIREGDEVTCSSFRKVSKDGERGTKGGATERVRVTVTLRVTSVDFDGDAAEVRVSGVNVRETEAVRLGAAHSATLATDRPFTVAKARWDEADAERLTEASDPLRGADLAFLLVSGQDGRAALALVGPHLTSVLGRADKSMPRKRGAGGTIGHARAKETFLDRCCELVERHVDWSKVRCLVVAGPGFGREEVRDRLLERAGRGEGEDAHSLLLNKDRIVLAEASQAGLGAIAEVLGNPALAKLVADTRASRDARALDEFLATLAADPSRAFYGPGHVLAAHELGAIETLLITDEKLRDSDTARRKRYVELVRDVRKAGGQVSVLSTSHESGKSLAIMTGLAARLLFPLPQLEDLQLDPDTGEVVEGAGGAVKIDGELLA